jgi:hypothetical protein
MVARLLDRQISLLEYLTSTDAIFGAASPAVSGQVLQGFDLRFLRLEARFSHEKRMEKIQAVFPHTLRLLGGARDQIVRDFADAAPQIDISRIVNARQFYDFLCAGWQQRSPDPPHLRDVAACEFAFAKARVGSDREEAAQAGGGRPPRGSIRRHPGVMMLRCEYDVRPIFESQGDGVVPVKRETLLATVIAPGAQHPQMFELPSFVFDFLDALDDWTVRSELTPGRETDAMIDELAEHTLVEVSL